MKLSISVILGLGLALQSAASPVRSKRRGYAIKESAPAPRGWTSSKPADGNAVLNLQIALKQSDIQGLKDRLAETSDPDHEDYGKHLTAEEANARVRPHSTTLEAVSSWLAEHGLGEKHVKYSPAQDWAFVRVPVELANFLLDTDFQHYTRGGDAVVRTESYSLPLHLHEHIDTIQPTTYFSGMKPFKAGPVPFTPDDLAQIADNAVFTGQSLYSRPPFPLTDFYCNSTVSVDCIRDLYGLTNYTASCPNNRLGVTAYLEEDANREDLQVYLKAQRPEAVGTTFTEYLVNGGTNVQTNENNNSSGTIEAGLDIQLTSGIAYPTPVVFWSTGGRPPSTLDPNTSEPYLEWLNYVMAQLSNNKGQVPQTITTSYGDDESSVPFYYAQRVCDGFAQLGAQGITLFFSSGDSGVGPQDIADCTNQVSNVTQFLPSFPASCPYVTTVGGTANIPNEAATTRFASGGGFSNYFAMPSYQSSAVSGYISELNAQNASLLQSYNSQNLYNSSGRAYPDLAGIADRWAVYVPGFYNPRDNNTFGWGLIGGTSSSSPAVASVFSQVNDYLVGQGKPSLGFMNPLLYSKLYPTFTDITKGSSFGCSTVGFPAATGWDAVTGFGTPNFVPILEMIKGSD